ncbi:hypothetical protein Bca4012_048845 [Brassica carinata]
MTPFDRQSLRNIPDEPKQQVFRLMVKTKGRRQRKKKEKKGSPPVPERSRTGDGSSEALAFYRDGREQKERENHLNYYRCILV